MKRIILLFALLSFASACSTETQKPTVAPKPAIDQTKFEALYRSAKSLQGGMTVGVSYMKFGELLRGLATEISIAKDKATSSNEKELVGLYAEAFKTYQDSYTLWNRKKDHPDYYWNDGETNSLVKKYNIPIKSRGFGGVFLAPEALKIIWDVAGKQLDKANKLYYSQEPLQEQTNKP